MSNELSSKMQVHSTTLIHSISFFLKRIKGLITQLEGIVILVADPLGEIIRNLSLSQDIILVM
jgi:hypothetical protein